MKSTWKGERRLLTTRIPVALAEVVQQRAIAAGLTVNEFLNQQLAQTLLPETQDQTVTAA